MTNEQMDALIAEKVMEWVVQKNKHGSQYDEWVDPTENTVHSGLRFGKWYVRRESMMEAFTPSTDLNHAFEALAHVCLTMGYGYCSVVHDECERERMANPINQCTCFLTNVSVRHQASHPSLATAICLALLQACGVEA